MPLHVLVDCCGEANKKAEATYRAPAWWEDRLSASRRMPKRVVGVVLWICSAEHSLPPSESDR
jgi:hypothetical protein